MLFVLEEQAAEVCMKARGSASSRRRGHGASVLGGVCVGERAGLMAGALCSQPVFHVGLPGSGSWDKCRIYWFSLIYSLPFSREWLSLAECQFRTLVETEFSEF